MRFLTKFALALAIPVFLPAKPFPPLATVTCAGESSTPVIRVGETFSCAPPLKIGQVGPIHRSSPS